MEYILDNTHYVPLRCVTGLSYLALIARDIPLLDMWIEILLPLIRSP